MATLCRMLTLLDWRSKAQKSSNAISYIPMPPTTSTTDFKHEARKIEHENYLDVEEGRSLLGDSSSIVNPGSYLGKDDHATSNWIKTLCVSNLLSWGIIFLIAWKLFTTSCVNPSVEVWSPANSAVEYVEQHFEAAFFTKTEFMGFPTDEIDQKWEDLYNFGNSIITEEESRKLHTPTLPIPGTSKYLVQLDVWHELHCLNDLRKVLYPERFGGLDSIKNNGTINREDNMFRHWDHCIDALRQTLMCHADVAPIPFHVNVPENSGIFARLATTHTCKNFTKIQEWAKDHSAGDFEYLLEADSAKDIIKSSGFDQSPEEDIQSFWYAFPGNLFFEHWRKEKADKGL